MNLELNNLQIEDTNSIDHLSHNFRIGDAARTEDRLRERDSVLTEGYTIPILRENY